MRQFDSGASLFLLTVANERKEKKPSNTARCSSLLPTTLTSFGKLLPLKVSLPSALPPDLISKPMTVFRFENSKKSTSRQYLPATSQGMPLFSKYPSK